MVGRGKADSRELTAESLLDRLDRDRAAQASLVMETHHARDLGEKRVVLAAADVDAGKELGPALAHEDRPAGDILAAERLQAEALGVRVAAVAGRALPFFVCHDLTLDRLDAHFDHRLAMT